MVEQEIPVTFYYGDYIGEEFSDVPAAAMWSMMAASADTFTEAYNRRRRQQHRGPSARRGDHRQLPLHVPGAEQRCDRRPYRELDPGNRSVTSKPERNLTMKYTWKHIFSLTLAGAMTLTLAACGQSSDRKPEPGNRPLPPTSNPTTTPPPHPPHRPVRPAPGGGPVLVAFSLRIASPQPLLFFGRPRGF